MPDEVLDSANKELVKQDMTMPNGEEYEYKDRRQEIVFIGKDMYRRLAFFPIFSDLLK